MTMRTARPQLRVTVSSPRLAASTRLTAAIARHQPSRLTLTVRLTDAGKLTTRLTSEDKPATQLDQAAAGCAAGSSV